MSSTPLTPKERFENAQQIQNDISSVSEIKLGAAANNSGAGILKFLTSATVNLRPDTELALNEALMLAINGVLDTKAGQLNTEFEAAMTTPVS